MILQHCNESAINVVLVTVVVRILWVIVYNATLCAYYISRVYSFIACESGPHNSSHERCGNMFVHTNDISGPANSIRLKIKWEQWMSPIIEKYCSLNTISLDIGSHIGTHTLQMAAHSQLVYAFEPNSHAFQTLKLNCSGRPNIKLFPFAVGEKTTQVPFKRMNINSRSFVEHFSNVIYVQQISIDDLQLPKVGFIKIDIEGGEVSAFKGMRKTLQRWQPIIVYEDHDGQNSLFLQTKHNYHIHRINTTNYIAMPESTRSHRSSGLFRGTCSSWR